MVALLLLLLYRLADLSNQTITSQIEVDQLTMTVVHLLERKLIVTADVEGSHHRRLKDEKSTTEALNETRERRQGTEIENESLKDENLQETNIERQKEIDQETTQPRICEVIAIEAMTNAV